MNLAAWFMAGILILNLVALFIIWRLLKIFGGELRKTMQLVPVMIVTFILAASSKLLEYLGVIKIRGAYHILELVWILLMILMLYRIRQLFTRLSKKENLSQGYYS